MTRIKIIAGQKYELNSSGIHKKIISDHSDVSTSEAEPYFNTKGEVNPDALPLIIVFSYNRGEMLLKNLQDISKFYCRIVVIDDGSEFYSNEHSKLCEFQRFDHHGKQGWWKLWNIALQIARLNGSYFNIFLPDDFQNTRIDYMVNDFERFPDLFACNVHNDGRESNWGDKTWTPYKKKWMNSNFVDCGFFCPYSVLEKLEFKINPIKDQGERSSGVGRQITTRLRQLEIPMYVPVKSYAFHGDHESVMHPQGRKDNPLVSI